jgi:hypothetical protein
VFCIFGVQTMDRFIDWLDTNNPFAVVGHTWPWAVITAAVAIAALVGIVAVARRYGSSQRVDGLNAA